MRVVIVSQWFPPENVAIPADVAYGLAASGHEVTVLTDFPNYPRGKIYDGWKQKSHLDSVKDGYTIRRIFSYPSHDLSAIRRALGYLSFGVMSSAFGWSRLRAADVVYVYHPPLTSAFGPWLSRRIGGAPYVLHVQDLWPDSVIAADMIHGLPGRLTERVLSRACERLYRRAAGVISIAPTMASVLRDRGVADCAMHVVHNWADESVFAPAERDQATAAALDMSGFFTVMFAGNVGHLQGLDVAIRAAAQVSDLRDFRLTIVGDGVARESLLELARDMGARNVSFVPSHPVEDMNAITHCADVQLVCLRDLPFFKGTIPSKLGAVLASGLPVICAVNGDAACMVETAGAGWVCAAADVGSLAKAFRSAHASSANERRDRGMAGRRYYEKNLSRSNGISQIARILHEAVATG